MVGTNGTTSAGSRRTYDFLFCYLNTLVVSIPI